MCVGEKVFDDRGIVFLWLGEFAWEDAVFRLCVELDCNEFRAFTGSDDWVEHLIVLVVDLDEGLVHLGAGEHFVKLQKKAIDYLQIFGLP